MHPNLKQLSHSSQLLQELCPRLFELDRLSPRLELEGEDVHLDFGKLLGNMVQSYLVSSSVEKVAWEAFLSYPRTLFQEALEEKEVERKYKKDLWFALYALDKFVTFRQEVLGEYTVATFAGKPATELGFKILCHDGFTYRGKLDAFLVDKRGKFAVFECKTTGSRSLHEAMYRNSGQGIGYSAIVDTIASSLGLQLPESFPIYYPVYRTTMMDWHDFSFRKSRASHANWIRHLLRTIQHVAEYAEDGYFPMHGQSCFSFNRACRFFESCELSNKYVVGPEEKVVVKVDKEEDYPFVFSLDELIAAQMEKANG